MASQFNKIPASISDYIREHFEGAFLSKISSSRDKYNKVLFHANISCDHVNYYLTFDADGNLVYTVAEPLEEIMDEESYGWYNEPMEYVSYVNA